jgi:hypothetical protein
MTILLVFNLTFIAHTLHTQAPAGHVSQYCAAKIQFYFNLAYSSHKTIIFYLYRFSMFSCCELFINIDPHQGLS